MRPVPLPFQDAPESEGVFADIDSAINSVFAPVNFWANEIIFWSPGWFPMPWIVAWLLIAAIVITLYLGFIQFRGLKIATEVIRGKFSSPDDPGEIPHFQALTSAVSGTVGLGNIAGVGAAVTIGGPGATFWMVLAGLLGMATKFAECTLGVKYRTVFADGTVSGGPFKYLPVAFGKFPKFLSVGLTGLFAVAILFFGVAGGNMFQANQTYSQAVEVTGGPGESFLDNSAASIIFGLVLATIIGLVIIGGIKSIGKVTSTLVPFMGGVYVLACFIVILGNVTQVPAAIGTIVSGAFNPDALTGGFVGVVIVGLQRAAFSNEAGLGSAPIAHSAVKTRRPVSEGFVALFEPFIDTVIICTFTALTIVIADTEFWNTTREELAADSSYDYGGGVAVTSDAFESVISWFPIVLAVAVALFAVSTLITWSYYGNKAVNYLFGESKTVTTLYRIVFLFFTVAGTVLGFGEVLGFADAFLFVCGFVNLLGVYFLLPTIKREMNEYIADRKSGKLYQLGVEDKDKDIPADQI
ncbi:MAG: alanine/glycine:cation symporter family protein [Ornithinimicrobium sp.]|uniref:alanine/glycine:cation symporter family protein n=1 Tax=Ornithinimicrobium sp. TaxID=1977084 RepID=UPI003D9AFB17